MREMVLVFVFVVGICVILGMLLGVLVGFICEVVVLGMFMGFMCWICIFWYIR